MLSLLNLSKKRYTGWLKLKYPTGQNAISRQPCEIFIPKVLGLYGRDPAIILKLKKKIILVFFPKVMAVGQASSEAINLHKLMHCSW